MLAALRLIHYLGFRVVFLLGADFTMSTDAKQNYAFEQGRTKHAVKHNNNLYQTLDRRFMELRKRFDDFWVFNCTQGSGLKAFPHYPFEKAVEYARAECGKAVDTAGWYDSSFAFRIASINLDAKAFFSRYNGLTNVATTSHSRTAAPATDAAALKLRRCAQPRANDGWLLWFGFAVRACRGDRGGGKLLLRSCRLQLRQ